MVTDPFALSKILDNYENLKLLKSSLHVLLVGAGGLGCEILKCLLMSGIRKIDVIDMDTIELSNLNRQFLFREEDIGKPKAEVAVKFVQDRFKSLNSLGEPDVLSIEAHVDRIENKSVSFYRNFDALICGLDSLEARRWLNSLMHSLVEQEGGTAIPIIDGGSEGFLGTTRLIIPFKTSCFECNIDWYDNNARRTYPLCAIAHTPRLPEHCIEYCKLIEWNDKEPFGSNKEFDKDNENNQ